MLLLLLLLMMMIMMMHLSSSITLIMHFYEAYFKPEMFR